MHLDMTLVLFLSFIAITLGITAWASRRSGSSASFFAANRQITAWQNGIAVARRLHECGLVPRYRRAHRLFRL